jgi:hypothetical protein
MTHKVYNTLTDNNIRRIARHISSIGNSDYCDSWRTADIAKFVIVRDKDFIRFGATPDIGPSFEREPLFTIDMVNDTIRLQSYQTAPTTVLPALSKMLLYFMSTQNFNIFTYKTSSEVSDHRSTEITWQEYTMGSNTTVTEFLLRMNKGVVICGVYPISIEEYLDLLDAKLAIFVDRLPQ